MHRSRDSALLNDFKLSAKFLNSESNSIEVPQWNDIFKAITPD